MEELQTQSSIAQGEESEYHFKYGFSAGLLVQQEAVEQLNRSLLRNKYIIMNNIQILIQDLMAFWVEKEKHKLYNKNSIYIYAYF